MPDQCPPLPAIGNCGIECPHQWRITWGDDWQHNQLLKTETNCIFRGEIDTIVPEGLAYMVEYRPDPVGANICGVSVWSPSSGPMGPYVVPEPSAGLLLIAGLVGLAILRRFKI